MELYSQILKSNKHKHGFLPARDDPELPAMSLSVIKMPVS